MAYVNCETEKMSEFVYLKKKLSLFQEVEIFSIIIFKKKVFWYFEIFHFSSFVVLRPTAWAM